MDKPVDIAANLRAAAKAAGKRQVDIARELGESPGLINNYFQGRRVPDRRMLERLAATMGTDADLLSGEAQSLTTVLAGVLTTLLRMNGLTEVRAALIAEVAVEALRVLKALPDAVDPEVRSDIAARAAWTSRTAQAPQR